MSDLPDKTSDKMAPRSMDMTLRASEHLTGSLAEFRNGKKVEEPKTASTLLGKTINSAWDLTLGEAKSDADKVQRAKKSDQYAEIAADTVSAIPKVGTVAGSLSRGVLLADMSGSGGATGFATKFASDTLQGAALNRVGKFGAASAEKYMAAGAQTTLGAEMKMHFVTGSAFGATKTVFNPHTYVDKEGKFSASATASNLALGTGVGGVLSMPAGYLGLRVTRASSLMLGTSAEMSVTRSVMQNTVSNASGGFASGFVFGGVEASREDFSLGHVTRGAFEGGVIGMFTGGAMGAADRPKASARPTEAVAPPVKESARPMEVLAPSAKTTARTPELPSAADRSLAADMPLTASPAASSKLSERTVRDGSTRRNLSSRDKADLAVEADIAAQSGNELAGAKNMALEETRAVRGTESDSAWRDTSTKDLLRAHPDDRLTRLWTTEEMQRAYDSFQFKPFERVLLHDVEGRVHIAGSENIGVFTPKAGTPTTHAEYEAMLRRTAGKGVEPTLDHHFKLMDFADVPHRVYEIDGLKTRIKVPEEYAARLDEVRELRRRMETPGAYHDLPMGAKAEMQAAAQKGDATGFTKWIPKEEVARTIDMLDALFKFNKHPLRDRVLPEDMIPALEALPQSNLLKEIILTDKSHDTDMFSRVQYEDENFSSAATITPTGKMSFPRAIMDGSFGQYVSHELSHMTKWANATFSKMFDQAHGVDLVEGNINHKKSRLARRNDPGQTSVEEPSIFHPSEHAGRNLDEAWAVPMGEYFMGNEPDMLLVYASRAPVRSLVLSAALEHGIKSGGKVEPGSLRENLLKRAEHIDDVVKPLAQAQMVQTIKSGTPEQKLAALDLLGRFGNASHIDELRAFAIDGRSTQTVNEGSATGAAGQKPRSLRAAAFEAIVRLSGDTPQTQLQAALSEGLARPELRETARDYVFRTNDARSPSYRKILEFDGNPTEIEHLVKVVTDGRYNDSHGQSLAYREIMQSLKNNPTQQVEWSTRMFERLPGVRDEVMGQMDRMVRAGLNPADLDNVMSGLNRMRSHAHGEEGPRLERIMDSTRNYQVISDAIRGWAPSQSDQIAALSKLAAKKDINAIKPLLELAVSGKPDVETAAVQALGEYSPNMVKHYARLLRPSLANDPIRFGRLDALMNGRGPGRRGG